MNQEGQYSPLRVWPKQKEKRDTPLFHLSPNSKTLVSLNNGLEFDSPSFETKIVISHLLQTEIIIRRRLDS